MTDLNLITSESKDEFFEALSKSIWLLLQDKLAAEIDKRLADLGHNDSEFDIEDHRWQVDEWINTAMEEYDMSGHEYQIEEMVNNHLEGKEMEATISFKIIKPTGGGILCPRFSNKKERYHEIRYYLQWTQSLGWYTNRCNRNVIEP